MKRLTFRIVSFTIYISTLLTLIYLFVLTRDVIIETDNPDSFNLDFENKPNQIMAYASLLAGILSFISILFIFLDLLYQRRLNTKDKEKEKLDIINEYYSTIELLQMFIEKMKSETIQSIKAQKLYSINEKEYPLKVNQTSQFTRTFTRMFNKIKTESLYDAFKYLNFKGNWKKYFFNINSIQSFLHKGIDELEKTNDIHTKKKYLDIIKIEEHLTECIDIIELRCNEITGASENLDKTVEYKLLENQLEIIKEILNNKTKTDYLLELWEEQFLTPFRSFFVDFINKIGLTNEIKSLMFHHKKATRLIEKVKSDSSYKSNNIIQQIELLDEKSEYFTKLNEIEIEIKTAIENRK